MKKVIKNTKKIIKPKKKSELSEFKVFVIDEFAKVHNRFDDTISFLIKKFDEKSDEMHRGFVAINEGFKEDIKEVFRSDFDKIDNKFDKVNYRLDKIEDKLERVEEEVSQVKVDVKAIKKHLIKDVDPRIENLESQYIKLKAIK